MRFESLIARCCGSLGGSGFLLFFKGCYKWLWQNPGRVLGKWNPKWWDGIFWVIFWLFSVGWATVKRAMLWWEYDKEWCTMWFNSHPTMPRLGGTICNRKKTSDKVDKGSLISPSSSGKSRWFFPHLFASRHSFRVIPVVISHENTMGFTVHQGGSLTKVVSLWGCPWLPEAEGRQLLIPQSFQLVS